MLKHLFPDDKLSSPWMSHKQDRLDRGINEIPMPNVGNTQIQLRRGSVSCVNSFSLNPNYAFQNNNLIIFWLKKGLGSVHISSKIKLMMMRQNPPHDIQIFVCSLWGYDTENHWLPGRKGQPSPHHNLLSGHSAALVWQIYQSTKLPLGQAPHPSCHPYIFSLTFSHVCYIPDLFVVRFTGEDFYFL